MTSANMIALIECLTIPIMFTNIFSEHHWKCLLLSVTFTENISEHHCVAIVFVIHYLVFTYSVEYIAS